MAQESFKDEKVAKIMNEDFVAIKVDREERPDLDEFYMKAVQALTGQGGWPLNVFLTPDLKPFYGGTYFPPVPKYGIPSFSELLVFVSELWKKKRDEVRHSADDVSKFVRDAYAIEPGRAPDAGVLDSAYATIVSSFDAVDGGFGGPPKFPLPTYAMFLLRYYIKNRKELALRAVTRTLDAISDGGIYDHLGGGFHRYSTDKKWLIPHFEKMLYDNALLVRAYLESFQVTRNPMNGIVAKETLGWMMKEMRDPDGGGFYSAEDADTIEGEGVYYSWTKEQVKSFLGETNGEIFSHLFGVTLEGNFEGGRSILHRTYSLADASRKFGLPEQGISQVIAESKQTLLEERHKRPRPSVDDKILAAWNGLAISAFSYAHNVFDQEDYLRTARKCADFVLQNMLKEGELFRRYREQHVAVEGTLDDYSFLVAGLLDLYESSFEGRYLERAIELNDRMLESFWDKEKGGLFFTRPSQELVTGIKEGYDGPTPSGNSVAALNLLRLADFTEKEELRRKAEEILRLFGEKLETEPSAHTYMLSALDYAQGSKEIVVAGGQNQKNSDALIREIRSRFIPNKTLMLVTDANRAELAHLTSLIEGKSPVEEKPLVYICENFTCKRPIADISMLRVQLDEQTQLPEQSSR
jgi:uncharacterized protein YyaL (SSP411 family)